MSIGVAIIGGGIFAREEHLPAVQACQHLNLRAVYSRSLKSAQSLSTESSSLDLYSDESGPGKSYEDLLARQDIQAVIIALPISNQPPFIKAALTAGKHVLSEKPIAGTVQEAQELLNWYRSSDVPGKPMWAVAENFRHLSSLAHASSLAASLGRLQTFNLSFHTLLTGGKYLETSWRATPTHQGGFILDGGVHFVAALRQLLGEEVLDRVCAFSRQNQSHLPPVDTIDACVRTKSGATGTIRISFGTTAKGNEYVVSCEGGTISVRSELVASVAAGGKPARSMKVTVSKVDSEPSSENVEDEGSGVKPEVRAWADSLLAATGSDTANGSRKENERQSPEHALADLEVLEAIFKSGEEDGAPQQLQFQIPSRFS